LRTTLTGVAAIFVAATALLSACGGTPEPNGSAPTSAAVPLAEFDTVPDFTSFGDCGHPCDAAVYPTPNPAKGTASITVKYPLESSQGQPGDRVRVICQEASGKPVSNKDGAVSSVWDSINVPKDRLTEEVKRQVPPGQMGVIGYVADMWLGNTGKHAPDCPGM
jgi:hypothetical protein